MLLLSLPFLLPFYMWEFGERGGFSLKPATVAALAYYGTFPSIVAYLFWNRGVVQVNLSGMVKRLNVGDVIEFAAGDRSCKVFYKQATPRDDQRVGFDLDCS